MHRLHYVMLKFPRCKNFNNLNIVQATHLDLLICVSSNKVEAELGNSLQLALPVSALTGAGQFLLASAEGQHLRVQAIHEKCCSGECYAAKLGKSGD